MYNAIFYSHQEKNQDTSPEIFRDFLQEKFDFSPKSVIDLGCGRGGFLNTFAKVGAKVNGLDGPWVPENQLLIPKSCFTSVDITKKFPDPIASDLAICLEMAEHLPAAFAEPIVDYLVRCSDVVYFSAAIPSQGGAGHVNEQWQDYWAELFLKKGYTPNLEIREFVWDRKDYSPYYAQNGILYIREGSRISKSDKGCNKGLINVIHPAIFNKKMRRYKWLESIYTFAINLIYK